MSAQPLHLALALDGAGLLTPRQWVDLVQEAERGLLDFVTIADSLGPPEDGRGRLDAVLIAARVAPLTRHIGLVPTATVTHTEPFHISKAIATLDYVSNGRAGWLVEVSDRPEDAAHFGRRDVPPAADLLAEAADYVEVVRRLWDSWEDDAEIRDAATGRFIDRDKLHYIDFQGRWFSVKGPSITPRPPQGQPLVTSAFALDAADIVFTDVPVPAGQSARELADQLLDRPETLFRLHAAPEDVQTVTRGLVPELQARKAFRLGYEQSTLRGLLGLPRPANRFVVESL